MQGLWKPIENQDCTNRSLEHIEKREPFLLSGAGDSVQNHLIAALVHFSDRPGLVITSNEMKAKEVYQELHFYYPQNTWYFPAKDPLFYSADVRGLAIEEDRMKVMQALRMDQARLIVMSIEALYDRLIPKAVWESFIIRKRIGDELPLDDLLEQLVRMGYERCEMVESPGQFSARGGIVDVYPITEDTAYRIELWGDEIDSIRVFDTQTQRSAHRLEYVNILPVSEIILTDDAMEAGLARIQQELQKGSAALRAE